MDLYSYLKPLSQKVSEFLELIDVALSDGDKEETQRLFKEMAKFNAAKKDVMLCMDKKFGEKMLSKETKEVLDSLGYEADTDMQAMDTVLSVSASEDKKVSLRSLLSFLRGIAHLYQHMHWHSAGTNYYGDHILYERLYGSAYAEIDALAEKAIGISDDSSVLNPIEDCKHTLKVVEKFASGEFNPESFSEIGITAEKEFIAVIADMMSGELSDGVQNMLQGIADKHEEHLYLLQQRNKSAGSIISKLVKVANSLDKRGKYSEAEKIDEMIKSLQERTGLNISGELASLANELDLNGLVDEASALDIVIKDI
jgi:DNA-binding ferritin-like protein